MRKLMKYFFVAVVAVDLTCAGLAIAAHAPHYPKKDHPVLRQKKMEHKAAKKERAMRAR